MTANDPLAELGADLTLDRYQELAAETDLDRESTDPLIPLLGLAGEVGQLVAEYKKRVRKGGESYMGFEAVMPIELGDILWYLATLARKTGRQLSEVAQLNLSKTRDRYVTTDGSLAFSFDDGFPVEQRFPRQFTATFATHNEGALIKCRLTIENDQYGALIDDNALYADDYRFHDIFHIAHAAVLGWSPVLRALIKAKRREDENTDRVEDGARAWATEEAVTAMIFELSKVWNYFDGSERVDDSILRAVKAVTGRLEVGAQPSSEWERAILTGYAAWRHLRDHQGGIIAVDLDARTVTILDT
jgi:NTP pyrophosphatase (non-canonical NTP hydrolase)